MIDVMLNIATGLENFIIFISFLLAEEAADIY